VLLRRRLHRGRALLHHAGQVRGDAEQPLIGHQLPAMVHLVLFGRQQHLEAALGWRLAFRRRPHADRLAKHRIRRPLEERCELVAFVLEVTEKLRLRARPGLFGRELLEQLLEVQLHHVGDAAAVDNALEHGARADVRQQFSDRARVGRRAVVELVLGDVFRDLDRVLADRAKRRRQLLAAVVIHRCLQKRPLY
jgi:hypothetical protein